jgi:hypothetical protein
MQRVLYRQWHLNLVVLFLVMSSVLTRLGVNGSGTRVNILLLGLLSTGQAAALIEKTQELCADLAPQSLALVEAFGLPEEMLRSPIGKIIQGWRN